VNAPRRHFLKSALNPRASLTNKGKTTALETIIRSLVARDLTDAIPILMAEAAVAAS